MSASATLDRALTDLLGKVHKQTAQEAANATTTASVDIMFSGGGVALPIAGGLPGMAKMPWAGRISSITLVAGDENLQLVPVTATVDLRRASILAPATSAPLYPLTPPALALDAVAYVDLTDWEVNLIDTEAIMYRLATFTGTATWLACMIGLTKTDSAEGSAVITDSAGNTIVDGDGNTIVFRS